MILADTSIWIDHLRFGVDELAQLLDRGLVICHPFVVGELALGNPARRAQFLRDLGRLPQAEVARQHEIMSMIEGEKLFGKGIGYVDCHLLASARLSGAMLWTRDKRLRAVASELGLTHD